MNMSYLVVNLVSEINVPATPKQTLKGMQCQMIFKIKGENPSI